MAAIEINREQFGQMAGGDKPVLVDFWAPWVRLLPQARARVRENRRGVRRPHRRDQDKHRRGAPARGRGARGRRPDAHHVPKRQGPWTPS